LTDERFTGGQWKVRVMGLDLIFKVLCLIAEIMIYRLPIRDSIDESRVDRFKERLEDLK
jgi:hypothetical protein